MPPPRWPTSRRAGKAATSRRTPQCPRSASSRRRLRLLETTTGIRDRDELDLDSKAGFILVGRQKPESTIEMKKLILTLLASAAWLVNVNALEYMAVPDWLKLPEGRPQLGNMHGDVAVRSKGEGYVSVMDPKAGVQVY